MTVKSELVEVPERLYALVGDVLSGFGASLHVLTDAQFTQLFVVESEVVTTWEDYERLIAMLVEQLMLKSYVAHLEREAARQMAELLLEVSLEDASGSGAMAAKAKASAKKKAKKKKTTGAKPPKALVTTETIVSDATAAGTSRTDTLVEQPEPEDFDAVMRDEDEPHKSISTESHDGEDTSTRTTVERPDASTDAKSSVLSSRALASASDCTAQRLGHVASPEKPATSTELRLPSTDASVSSYDSHTRVSASSLNPHASVFEPQTDRRLASPRHVIRKRKLDSFIVALDDDDDDLSYDSDALSYASDDDDSSTRCRTTTRWRTSDDTTALAWQLEQIYASTATMLGWDASRQCDVDDTAMALAMPWGHADALWRTAPTEVVRYFTPGHHDLAHAVSPFFQPPPPPTPSSSSSTSSHAHAYLHPFPGAPGSSSSQMQQPPLSPKSRYYFAPPASTASAVPSAMPPPYLPASSGPATGASGVTRRGSGASPQPLIKSYYHAR